MRPVKKGGPHLYVDGEDYPNARNGLVARLGLYCSYCERKINSAIEVEHIQHKSHYTHLEKKWENFLLSCKNCNTIKGTKDFPLAEWLIPDRDNTYEAYIYDLNGEVQVNPNLSPNIYKAAKNTHEIVGLDKEINSEAFSVSNQVYIDRKMQRMEIWLKVNHYKKALEDSYSELLEDTIIDLALANGFFSIWMKGFDGNNQFRQKLIKKFVGTEVGCFDPINSNSVSPHPNADKLIDGGKL